jgi:hypothetical protein
VWPQCVIEQPFSRRSEEVAPNGHASPAAGDQILTRSRAKGEAAHLAAFILFRIRTSENRALVNVESDGRYSAGVAGDCQLIRGERHSLDALIDYDGKNLSQVQYR